MTVGAAASPTNWALPYWQAHAALHPSTRKERTSELETTAARDLPLTELVQKSREGDRQAFGQIVLQLQRPLYFASLRIVSHSQDARDVVQKAFLKAWTRLEELESPAKFRSWLFAIGLNLARNLVRDRAQKRFEPIEENTLVSPCSAETQLSRRQQSDRLRAALGELPPRQQEVVTLRIDGELSFREIGESVGCSEGSARVNFHYGMKRLKEILNPVSQKSGAVT